MATCDLCKTTAAAKHLHPRLAVPEYRAMTGFWPWVELTVCEACLEAHDRDFLERLRLLAPDVLENDEPIVGEVCLVCGRTEPKTPWVEASKWVDAEGNPTRRSVFRLCPAHAKEVYVDGVIVSSNLVDEAAMGQVLAELPTVGADMLARIEGWRPNDTTGPAGASDFTTDRTAAEATRAAFDFWAAATPGLKAKAAWLGPIRKDYRMRYRLDLVRDHAAGRREMLSIVRTGRDQFATYRTTA